MVNPYQSPPELPGEDAPSTKAMMAISLGRSIWLVPLASVVGGLVMELSFYVLEPRLNLGAGTLPVAFQIGFALGSIAALISWLVMLRLLKASAAVQPLDWMWIFGVGALTFPLGAVVGFIVLHLSRDIIIAAEIIPFFIFPVTCCFIVVFAAMQITFNSRAACQDTEGHAR